MSRDRDINSLINLFINGSHEFYESFSELNRELESSEERDDIKALQFRIANHPMNNYIKVIKELSISKKNIQSTEIIQSSFDFNDDILTKSGLLGLK